MNGYFLIYVFNIGFNDLWCFSLYKINKNSSIFLNFTLTDVLSKADLGSVLKKIKCRRQESNKIKHPLPSMCQFHRK